MPSIPKDFSPPPPPLFFWGGGGAGCLGSVCKWNTNADIWRTKVLLCTSVRRTFFSNGNVKVLPQIRRGKWRPVCRAEDNRTFCTEFFPFPAHYVYAHTRSRDKLFIQQSPHKADNTHHHRHHHHHHHHHHQNRIQRRKSRFLTISSLRCELSPTRTFKYPGRNRVQHIDRLSCATCVACHEGTAQLLSLTEFESHLF